jgi:S1-C subfamily serine protease
LPFVNAAIVPVYILRLRAILSKNIYADIAKAKQLGIISGKVIREHFALFMARLLNDKFKSYQTNAYIRKYEQSVVIIVLYDEKGQVERQGSGFITSNNLIATSFENIRGGVKAEAFVEGTGETFLLEGVVDYNEDYDVALLKPVKKTGRPSLLFGKYSTVKLSDTVYAFGFNTMVYPKFRDFREGKVEDLLEVEMDSGDFKIIESLTKFDYGPDYYGGPLLNAKGYVIGMTSDALYDIDQIAHYYAISSDHIDAMVEPYREVKFSNIEVEIFSDMPGYGYVGEDE